MTPPASWRPSLPAGAFVVGPATCQSCGDPVWFGRSLTRVSGEVALGEVQAWREWGRYAVHGCVMRASRARVRATCDNEQVGSSDESNRLPNDARVSATTRGAGVVAPIEVVAR